MGAVIEPVVDIVEEVIEEVIEENFRCRADAEEEAIRLYPPVLQAWVR